MNIKTISLLLVAAIMSVQQGVEAFGSSAGGICSGTTAGNGRHRTRSAKTATINVVPKAGGATVTLVDGGAGYAGFVLNANKGTLALAAASAASGTACDTGDGSSAVQHNNSRAKNNLVFEYTGTFPVTFNAVLVEANFSYYTATRTQADGGAGAPPAGPAPPASPSPRPPAAAPAPAPAPRVSPQPGGQVPPISGGNPTPAPVDDEPVEEDLPAPPRARASPSPKTRTGAQRSAASASAPSGVATVAAAAMMIAAGAVAAM